MYMLKNPKQILETYHWHIKSVFNYQIKTFMTIICGDSLRDTNTFHNYASFFVTETKAVMIFIMGITEPFSKEESTLL